MYTIGQVSELFQLPISTLRYYDAQGLFPGLARKSGVRQFSDTELDILRLIECLKQSGLEIKDIKQFMDWQNHYDKRLELLKAQKEQMEASIQQMKKSLAMLDYKIWYYEMACQQGKTPQLEQMPEQIRSKYELAHSDRI